MTASGLDLNSRLDGIQRMYQSLAEMYEAYLRRICGNTRLFRGNLRLFCGSLGCACIWEHMWALQWVESSSFADVTTLLCADFTTLVCENVPTPLRYCMQIYDLFVCRYTTCFLSSQSIESSSLRSDIWHAHAHAHTRTHEHEHTHNNTLVRLPLHPHRRMHIWCVCVTMCVCAGVCSVCSSVLVNMCVCVAAGGGRWAWWVCVYMIYHRCTYQEAITWIILAILELRSRCVGACVCACSHNTREHIIICTTHMKLEAINVSFDHVGVLGVEVQVRMCVCEMT